MNQLKDMTAISDAARAIHGGNAAAVLGYGSCLRDGVTDGRIADIYVLVHDLSRLPGPAPLRLMCRLLPPNVYYMETQLSDRTLRAKCAVLSLGQFASRMDTHNPYFWARFSQPAAILFAHDDQVRKTIEKSMETAINTMIANTLPLMTANVTPQELWTEALSRTYATEWRSEGASRAGEIVAANLSYYEDITPKSLSGSGSGSGAKIMWLIRRITGKAMTTMRLAKAAFTYQGGLDYILWKIERHSGVSVKPTPFQKRHPLISAPALAWKIYRLGGFR